VISSVLQRRGRDPSADAPRGGLRKRALRGQATLEFALILPLLLALVGGTCDFGMFMFQREQAASCVRTVARKASVRSATAMSTTEAPQCQKAASKGASAFTMSPTTITGTTPAAGSNVTVTINYLYDPIFLDLILPMTGWSPLTSMWVTASVTMRMEAAQG
jgi:Flp pilus assembly protein TadG